MSIDECGREKFDPANRHHQNKSVDLSKFYDLQKLSEIQIQLTPRSEVNFCNLAQMFGSPSRMLSIWKPFSRQLRHIDASGLTEADEPQPKMESYNSSVSTTLQAEEIIFGKSDSNSLEINFTFLFVNRIRLLWICS